MFLFAFLLPIFSILTGINPTSEYTMPFESVSISPIKDGIWSDPSIWPNGMIPNSSDDVIIPADLSLILLGECSAKSIRVFGELSAYTNQSQGSSFQLSAEYILVTGVSGRFSIGTSNEPYLGESTITLTGARDTDNIMGMGDKFLIATNEAQIELHGSEKKSWTQLSITAEQGANTMSFKEPVDWEIGDEIIIASSEQDQNQAEQKTIVAISSNGQTITLDSPLNYRHFAEIQNYTNGKSGSALRQWTVDYRTEVGLLSRNIKIQGDASSSLSGYGGHIMIMPSAVFRGENIELHRMGQSFLLARYPIHWHINGDISGEYLKNSTIHESYNRGVVIHGSNNGVIENNVVFNIWGSAIFLEDGVETGNQIKSNLVLGVHVPPHAPENLDFTANTLLGGQNNPLGIVPSDYQQDLGRVFGPSAFWITNADNVFEDNVVAGSHGVGFWYGLPLAPTGLASGNVLVKPREIPITSFKGNRAHSVATGLHFDHSHDQDQEHLTIAPYRPKIDGQGVWTVVEDFTCYKMKRGWWTRTNTGTNENVEFRDIKLLDCEGDEMIISSWKGRMYDCLFVGQTNNVTLFDKKENTAAMSFYDGGYEVYTSHFQDFNLPYHSVFGMFGGAADRCNDFFTGCTFQDVQFYNERFPMRPVRMSGLIRDVDGDITNIPDASIFLGHPFLVDQTDFTQLQPGLIGYKSNTPVHGAKVEFKGSDTGAENSMYAEWGDGHVIHGSVWGANNQFTVIPGLDRLYTFRWLNEVPSETNLAFRYTKEDDIVDLVMAGSNESLALESMNPSTSKSALYSSLETGYFWDNAEKQLYIRLKAENDNIAEDLEYNARKIVKIVSLSGNKSMATRNFEIKARPFNGIPHSINSIIEAEHFDYGGQYIGYLEKGNDGKPVIDNISNGDRFTPLTYEADVKRLGEVVDLNFSKDQLSNESGITKIRSGEYWNYSVQIPANDAYNLFVKIKSDQPDVTFKVKIDGSTVLESTIQTIGEKYQRLDLGSVFINSGLKVITIEAVSEGFELDWLAIKNNATFLEDQAGDFDGDGKTYNEEIDLGRDPNSVCDLGFEFDSNDDLENWWNISQFESLNITNGVMVSYSETEDASINSPYSTFNGSDIRYIQVRMKASENGLFEFFWENENGSYNSTRRMAQNYSGNNTWQILTLDMTDHPEWVDQTIFQYRVDPLNKISKIEIDWIRASCVDVVDTSADQDGDGKTYTEEIALGRDPFDVCDMATEFNIEDDKEGWFAFTNMSDVQVGDGTFKVNTTSADPSMVSPAINFNGDDIKTIQVRLKSSKNGLVEFFWKNLNGSFNGNRRVAANYTGNNQWETVIFNLSEHEEWVGYDILSYRLDPVNQIAQVEVDWIRGSCQVINNPNSDVDGDGKTYLEEIGLGRNPFTVCDLASNFNSSNDFEGWTLSQNITNEEVQNGTLSGFSTNGDPNLTSPKYAFSGDSIHLVQVRLKAGKNGLVEFFWQNENGGFNGTRRIALDYTGNGNWQNMDFIVKNESQWKGKEISKFRLDPIGQSTFFEVDWIRGYCCLNIASCDEQPQVFDSDGDGFLSTSDCNDNNPAINPGATEIPNNDIDEDCDGTAQIIDVDNDGYNSDEDCDDTSANINPGLDEIPNNDVDENCDGIVLIIDVDNDGYNSDEDCDDTNAEINPGQSEIPNNDVDEDCDGESLIIDIDGDGYHSDIDCNDLLAEINPGQVEIPNNDIDENCDCIILIIDVDGDGFNSDEDCDDTNPNINPDAIEIPQNQIDENCDGVDGLADADNDGYLSDVDCDDENENINPGASEIPNNDIDENCDGIVLIIDEDGDGYNSDEDCDYTNPDINPGELELANNGIDENCDGTDLVIDQDGDGYPSDIDCNDVNPNVNPGVTEIPYNMTDDDCDEATLDDDLDGDGFGIEFDCNDDDSSINPDAEEIIYNGVDDDCNAETLDDDLDGDGFGIDNDCDDTMANINPDAIEIPNNGIDEDCDGQDLMVSTVALEGFTFTMYPNPTSDNLIIESNDVYLGDYQIQIYDANGNTVHTKYILLPNGKYGVTLSHLPSGIYYLELRSSITENKITSTIIKVKN